MRHTDLLTLRSGGCRGSGSRRVQIGHGFSKRAARIAAAQLFLHIHPQQREDQLGKPIGFLEMRLAREHKGVYAQIGIFLDAVGHSLGAAHQGRARTATHQTHAGP